ncbi:hypothetical protein [Actinomadura litoris]|uniref:hypothetical protein n=1 Tax=Actinomadura litoris TaxID=2678616 RepID=UPI001FA7C5C2|nr:hypothetical protein [Actinomadura litoris]
MTTSTPARPDPRGPEALTMLRKAIAVAQDLAHDLNEASTPSAYEAVSEVLSDAYDRARDLARPHGRTGCARHPDGAVDTQAPDGWGVCLLCNTHRRQAARPEHTGQADEARQAAGVPAPQPVAEPSPEYVKAAEKLSYLPDLGGASIQAAREQLGMDAPYDRLVMYAAEHPVVPPPAASGRVGGHVSVPSCEVCETALDPDGSCLTCAQALTRAPDQTG